ncbi:hypothetical protein [Taibaiella koreensis]|uniref:hypothetical protein n=1 Tax=Taibaiella koreensis TaxID=1268548 RepID=UPI0013C2A43A|nr:hypothetical protein [Taibaiella koreensis]
MKQLLLLFLLSFIVSGCEPSYRIYVCNNTSSDVYIKTHPEIESLYSTSNSYIDAIRRYKVGQAGKYGVYRLGSNDTLMLDGNIGSPTIKEIPFDYISLISNNDTVILDNKVEIFKQIKGTVKKGRSGNYYINVGK